MINDLLQHYFGAYVGIVAYTKDPEHLGRVQVRVHEIHGVKEDIPDDHLPWAYLTSLGGGFPDGGSHIPPPIGATVLVVFEHGDPNRPWVLGGVPKRTTSKWRYGTTGASAGIWQPKADDTTDVPREVRSVAEEAVNVVLKTPKGATVLIDERDGLEALKIIDRSGQVVELDSPVTSAANAGNGERRGTRVAPSGVPDSSMGPSGAKIKVTDLAGQTITMTAKAGSESITLVDKKGQIILMEAGAGQQRIRLQSSSGNYIEINSVTGVITIKAATKVEVNP